MKENRVHQTIILSILVGLFYLLPSFAFKQEIGAPMALLVFIFPLFVLLLSIVDGYLSGFNWLIPIGMMVFWLPTILIYYNNSAFIYTFIYGIISVIGEWIGNQVKKK